MIFILAVLALLAATAAYLYRRLQWLRFQQYSHFPMAKPDLIWGHMKVVNDAITEPGAVPGAHSDYAFKKLLERNGDPEVLLFDVRPVQPPVLLIYSPYVAEQITGSTKSFRYSWPKSPTMWEILPAVGARSMLVTQGHEWKTMRKQFNPGFAPRHLLTMLPAVVDKTRNFVHKLDARCASGDVFSLDETIIRLTFDIIGVVTMGVDFNVQGSPVHPVATEMLKLLKTYSQGSDMVKLNPFVRRRRTLAGRATDAVLKAEIKRQFHLLRASDPYAETQRAKSVLALALQDTTELTEDALQDANDQIKTFLLAGHDTTSILLSWAFYQLSLHPHALAAACAELDSVFGPSTEPEHIMKLLLESGSSDDLLARLPYISAIIKETLRLYPPAGTARYAEPGSNTFITLENGERLCVDGMVHYVCAYVIHRNRKVYGDTVDDFLPERWLGNTDTSQQAAEESAADATSTTNGGIPASAWRPFERGPRNCIGQELANIEARVILAVVLRRYRFDKIGVGQPKVDEKGQKILNSKGKYEVESELVNMRQITLKPIDGMQMRVRFA